MDEYDEIIRNEKPCARRMGYKSVIGYGRAYFVADNNDKKMGLNCILRIYGQRMQEFSDDDTSMVCAFRIEIHFNDREKIPL